MELLVKLKLAQNDAECLKGNELRDEVVSQVTDIQIDGWEVTDADIVERKSSGSHSFLHAVLSHLSQMDLANPDAPCRVNRAYTNRGMVEWWIQELRRLYK